MIKIKDIAYNKESKTHHKLFFLAEFLERKKEEERWIDAKVQPKRTELLM